MRTKAFITETANELYVQAKEGLDKYAENQAHVVSAIMTDDFQSAYEKVGVLVQGIKVILGGAVSNDIMLPKCLTRLSTQCTDKLTSVTVSVSSKLKAEHKFKERRTIEITENLIKDITKLVMDTLFDAFYTEMAIENIESLNEELQKIYDAHEIKKQMFFAVETGKGRVVEINNDKVILNADIERALELASNSLVAGGNEYLDMVHDEAVKAFVGVMQTVEITPEILKKRMDITDLLCDMRTKKRSNKIIRESYKKNSRYLESAKDGITYFNEKVDDIAVFALVQMNESGDMEYVLNPFDAEKLVSVDTDVIGLLRA